MLRLLEEWNDMLLALTQAPVRSSVEDLRPFLGLREPTAAHPPVQAARLQWQLKPRGERVEERFRFRSPLRSRYPRNDQVKGQRWRREEARLSGTALLMLHAAFAPNHHPERVYSRDALERGAHVFVISLPYHIFRRPRDSRYSGQYLFSGDVPRLIRGIVQAAADTRAMVLGLRERIAVVYGTEDVLVPEDAMIALLRAWGEPPAHALRTGHRLIAHQSAAAAAAARRLGRGDARPAVVAGAAARPVRLSVRATRPSEPDPGLGVVPDPNPINMEATDERSDDPRAADGGGRLGP